MTESASPAARRLTDLVGELRETGPAYAALADRIRLLIGDGRLPVDSRLPSERDLSEALGLSRTTVSRAYAELRDGGYLASRVGSGSRVALPSRVRGAAQAGLGLVPADVADGEIDLTCAATRATAGVLAAYENAVADLPGHLATAGYHPTGLPSLRAAIAARYEQRGLPTDPEQVVVTTGAIAGIGLLTGALIPAGRRVLLESPGSPNTIAALRRHGARLVPLPVEPTGWHLDSTEALVRSASAHAAVILPDFHNPTGALLGDDGRARLSSALRRAGTVTIVDETVAEIDLDPDAGPLPLPWAAHDDTAFSVGSSSKTHWGGLRIGWIRSPRGRVEEVQRIAAVAGIGAPALEQLTLQRLLRRQPGLEPGRRADILASRQSAIAALHEHLPAATFVVPRGGLSLWLELPEANATQVAIAALDEGLHLASGPRFAVGHGLERWLRLPHVAAAEVQVEAVRRLARAHARVVGGEAPRGREREARPIVA
jgi:DNA-binding transcriptional MocR family regulator